MTIQSGTRLGPYEVVGPIGAGGMGEVYRAKDTRLERSVAIKILPAEFAANTQLRLRFEREAKTISQLNHPHICTLFDVGHDQDIHYLVMEYVEGESLADRVVKGPLPIEQVLRYGIEIADRWTKPTGRESSIATSSPAMSCSPNPERSCWTSDWPSSLWPSQEEFSG